MRRLGRAVTLAVAGAACASGPPRIMSWSEYSKLRPEWPRVVRLSHGQGELLYYGGRHTYLPADPQIDEIERLWSSFRPTIALNEGGNPPVEASRELQVLKSGEAGWVRFLAARDDVPVISLDPSRSEEVAHLSRTFSRQDVKLFFLLRGVWQFRSRDQPGTLEAEVERVLRIYNATPGMGGPPRTEAEVVPIYQRRFAGQGAYRNVPGSWFDPVREESWLNAISRTSSDYRDRYMIALLARQVADGQRVFAVVGGTHVIMQERALRTCIARGRRGS
jgi:hypothetical protein